MIIAVTGHRPEKLGGYSEEAFIKLVDFAKQELSKLNPEKIISGMAIGWDTAVAIAALELKIPLLAAVPFSGQEKIWPQENKDIYNDILKHNLVDTFIVNPGGFQAWKMQARNQWMVDNCDILMALYNFNIFTGGTKNCIDYAINQNKKIINLWPQWESFNKNETG